MARAGRYVRWGYARKVMLSTRPHANAGLRTKGHADARGCQCVTKSRGCEPTLHLELQVSLHGSLLPQVRGRHADSLLTEDLNI
jgi:hypothetical protein